MPTDSASRGFIRANYRLTPERPYLGARVHVMFRHHTSGVNPGQFVYVDGFASGAKLIIYQQGSFRFSAFHRLLDLLEVLQAELLALER